MSDKIAEWVDNEKWVRSDGKECNGCQNTFSTSPELFEVEFEDGEKLVFCSVCIEEGPFSNEPEKINIIKRVK